MAAVFFFAAGLLVLTNLPLAPVEARRDLTAAVAVTACILGVVVWVIPWQQLPRRASLVLVPFAFALIAVGNAVGGRDYFSYGLFFVIAFVWIGLAHPPLTGLAMAPLAVAAYLAPIPTLPEIDRTMAATSALLVLPVSILTGEVLARGLDRQARTEAALRGARAAAEQLRDLEAMKDRFLRAASHEFRTPVTVCRGHLDVLSRDPNAEELRETVGVLTDELDRMARMVDDITSLTRLEDPRSLRPEPIDVPRLMRAIGVKADPLLGERTLIVDAAQGEVCADPQRLTQALLALLDNSATHARAARSVNVTARRHGGSWRFTVADDGEGVGPIDGDLFEPFRHDHDSTGSGLGLAVVRAIAEAHGGEAGLDRARPRGAAFWISIPA